MGASTQTKRHNSRKEGMGSKSIRKNEKVRPKETWDNAVDKKIRKHNTIWNDIPNRQSYYLINISSVNFHRNPVHYIPLWYC